ncbi:hypothetical protein [Myroides indicus]|uniref:Uncharacterized protein n=1 Tax=Myroides indicus TaxID=1323422 RepID=A0A4R7F016_9FLAO|nr:hypothetical protein [Myroides indicus]TDS63572.1 hypothetical protein C8P70_1062 [Myroides indicus]
MKKAFSFLLIVLFIVACSEDYDNNTNNNLTKEAKVVPYKSMQYAIINRTGFEVKAKFIMLPKFANSILGGFTLNTSYGPEYMDALLSIPESTDYITNQYSADKIDFNSDLVIQELNDEVFIDLLDPSDIGYFLKYGVNSDVYPYHKVYFVEFKLIGLPVSGIVSLDDYPVNPVSISVNQNYNNPDFSCLYNIQDVHFEIPLSGGTIPQPFYEVRYFLPGVTPVFTDLTMGIKVSYERNDMDDTYYFIIDHI